MVEETGWRYAYVVMPMWDLRSSTFDTGCHFSERFERSFPLPLHSELFPLPLHSEFPLLPVCETGPERKRSSRRRYVHHLTTCRRIGNCVFCIADFATALEARGKSWRVFRLTVCRERQFSSLTGECYVDSISEGMLGFLEDSVQGKAIAYPPYFWAVGSFQIRLMNQKHTLLTQT